MSWKAFGQILTALQEIDDTDTVQNYPLGLRIQGVDSNGFIGEFIYLKGVASTAVGSWVIFKPDDWSTKLLDSDESGTDKTGDVAIAMSANVASQYGWYQIYGKASGLCLSGYVDNALVWITSTGGSVDDTIVDGYMVHRALGASDRDTTTGLADFEISYPYIDGITTND